ncbi:MAG TPA: hypothetical protein DD618_03730 [Acholeplasmatales bacterium]|nr:hypothetical protein [Acholeplasmatales bacterium]
MDILEKHNHYILLFDFYGVALTEKQQNYFQDYYFKDASLAEIAESNQISRAAVYDQLKNVYKILDNYEEKLGLYRKFEQRNAIYEEFARLDDENVKKMIEKLKETE